jgi:hypothetical protein
VHAVDQHVAQPLVIALEVIVLDVLSNEQAQVPLTEWNDATQAL